MARQSTSRKRATQDVIDEATLDEMAIRKLKSYVKRTWSVLEPGEELLWNWHIDLICDELEGIPLGRVRDLLINIPPGCMKSLLVSVFFPSWWWLTQPEMRFVTFANIEKLATRDSKRMRDILQSDIYADLRRRAVGHMGVADWGMSNDQNQKVNFQNTRRGFRECFGLGGTITGARGHGMIVDDPHDVSDIIGSPEQVIRRMDDTADIIGKVLPTRVNKPKTAWSVTIQQRVHEEDTAGRKLKEGKCRTVILQMEYDPDFEHNHPLDPRTEFGELLFPDMFDSEYLDALKLPHKLGLKQYSAQFQQLPVPSEGGLFKKQWFTNFYDSHPQDLAPQMDEITISADLTFKGSKATDFVSIQVWGRKGVKHYLLHQVWKQMNYPDTRREFIFVCRMFPTCQTKLVEEAANGAALIADLQSSISGLIPINPHASKSERAQIGSLPAFESGNVFLPTPDRCPWILGYIAEHTSFPMGRHDDQVDATSQYLLRANSALEPNALDLVTSQFAFFEEW